MSASSRSRSGMLCIVLLVTGAAARAATIPPAPPPGIRCDCLEHGGFADVRLESTGPAVLTVDPSTGGETLEQEGIRLRVRLMCNPNSDPADRSNAVPAAGIPAQEIVLYSPTLSTCVYYFTPAQGTDLEGWTEFTGTIRAGGCAERLTLYWAGIALGEVPLRINSPDSGAASPGAVDAGDLAALTEHFGDAARYSICFDYNEDGAIDAGDVARFAQSLGGACP